MQEDRPRPVQTLQHESGRTPFRSLSHSRRSRNVEECQKRARERETYMRNTKRHTEGSRLIPNCAESEGLEPTSPCGRRFSRPERHGSVRTLQHRSSRFIPHKECQQNVISRERRCSSGNARICRQARSVYLPQVGCSIALASGRGVVIGSA